MSFFQEVQFRDGDDLPVVKKKLRLMIEELSRINRALSRVTEVTSLPAASIVYGDSNVQAALDSLFAGGSGGSGGDADTLNGQPGTYYLNWNNFLNVPSCFTPCAHTHAADDISYDHSVSGLAADNVQSAIDEIVAGGSGYTDEDAQDAVGGILDDGGDIDFTYDDATPKITAVVKIDAVTYAKMQNVSAASKLLGRGDSGAGDPQEITLGTNLSMSGTTLNASSGSANVTPDTHPGSPNAIDDEFEAGSLDAKWTALNTPTSSFAQGSMVLSDSSNTADNIAGYYQTIAGNFKIRTKCARALNGATDNRGGLILRNAAATKIYTFGVFYNTGAAALEFYANKLTADGTTFSANLFTSSANAAGVIAEPGQQWWYLEIEYDGTTLTFRASQTGITGTFLTLSSEAAATFLGTPNGVGVYADRGTATASNFVFDWFRGGF